MNVPNGIRVARPRRETSSAPPPMNAAGNGVGPPDAIEPVMSPADAAPVPGPKATWSVSPSPGIAGDAVAVVGGVSGQHLDPPAIERDVLVVVGLERVARRQLLEAAALFPEAAAGTKVRQPRFGAHARAGEHDGGAMRFQQLGQSRCGWDTG